MTQKRINIINNSGVPKTYCLFNSPPLVTGIPSSSVFTNVWQTIYVPANQSKTINVTLSFNAYAGTTTTPVGQGVNVSGGGIESIQLGGSDGSGQANGSNWYIKNDGHDNPYFANELYNAQAGCFAMTMGTDFTTNNNWVIGLGMPNAQGVALPTASISPTPNLAYSIQPIIKFWVSETVGSIGDVINYSATSAVAGLADFVTNNSSFACTITQNDHGAFSSAYSSMAAFSARSNLSLFVDDLRGSKTPTDWDSLLKQINVFANAMDMAAPDPTMTLPPMARFVCKVLFQATTNAVIFKGIDMMVDKMMKDHPSSYQQPQQSDIAVTDGPGSQKTGSVTFTKNSSASALVGGVDPLTQVTADWKAAVPADTQPDGHTFLSVAAA